MTLRTTIDLTDGIRIPQLGLGTARVDDDDTIRRIVLDALSLGYRHVDTAARYDNERGVGLGLAEAGLARDEVFVTTKLRGSEQGYTEAKDALRRSLDRLGLDYVDLYLIHWPLPRLGRYVDSWRALEELKADGLTRAIGVSNFLPEHLDALAASSDTVPAVNQIELHPRYQQPGQRDDNARRGIVTESWSPFANDPELFQDPVLTNIATGHDVTAAQVVLRWHLQLGLVVIPKASHPDRLRQNIEIDGFELSADEMSAIARLDTGVPSQGQDPATYEEF